MKNIVLAAINAKYIHSNLAIHSLRAYAVQAEEEMQAIQIREYTINQPFADILKDIYKSQPGFLGLSCYIWNRSLVDSLLVEIRKILPETWIWVGGPEVTYDAVRYLEDHPAVDGVIRGEGEASLLGLLRHFQAGNPVDELLSVPGLTLRHGEDICDTGSRELLDMDELPFPYYDLWDFENRIIYYESSRGCPFSCSYCLSSLDKKLRFRNLELVKKELLFFIEQKVPQVKFVDRTFNCDRQRALEIWRFLAEHDQGVTNFHFEIGADLLGSEEIACMRGMRPGLIQLEIGVQSTNPDTIREIHRRTDLAKLRSNVEQIRQGRNIHQHLDLIAGLPCEGYESFTQSFDQVYRMYPQQIQLGFLKVLKGSRMERMAESYGCVYMDREPYEVLKTKWISYEEILALKRVEEMVEIYYNSGQFCRTLALLEGMFSSPFALYQSLGDFYEEKGYGGISHSRLHRYDVLLEFLESWGREQAGPSREALIEAMTVDLYSRENLKSRPAWMKGQEPWQKSIRAYIRREGLPKTVHIEVLSREILFFDYRYRDPLTNNVRAVSLTSLDI
ncbi:MAG: B12-binding domain-containing radical SAM protein [Lachnospiraceae bacterium]|nr:B12-binding domain-containing radical SAM protein [Lachnospiraceae bacterium]